MGKLEPSSSKLKPTVLVGVDKDWSSQATVLYAVEKVIILF